jgi:inorganic pyrophosphatase
LAPWAPYICTILGLSSGIIIYYFTSLFTNYNYSIIKKSANSCNDGNTMSMIYGLSLSYISTFFPVVCISLTIYGSCTILGFYGVSLAALGMLSNIPIYLSLNTYRSIC